MKNLAVTESRGEWFSLKTAIVLGVLFLTSLGFLRIKIEHTRTGYEITSNRETEQELIKEGQNLRYELSKLKSHEYLEPVAKKMGFRFATYKDVVFVEEVMVAEKTE